ncbi:MAG TPA: DUF3575 domain-containing protein [Lacibacter sp.]|nr:DUF3575 domain-containing protein [Lacibacter sp.]HMO87870.1 DUF3575 domain-containing protein [Lacibacter sp.]HMP87905.1 DUF3575 domain-containing protein [Lacibacter sp.]
MKQLLLTVVALFVCGTLLAQGPQPQIGIGAGGKNIIKYNLSGTALSHYAIQYERVTTPRQSFALGLGISPNVGLPFKQTLLDQFGDNTDARRAIESTRFTKFTITPEYRFYVGKKGAPSGFYIAPFGRYTYMDLEQVYTFTPSSGREHKPLINGTFRGVGGGVLFGSQWLLGKKQNIVLDWWIAGPFIGSMNASFNGKDDMSDMSAADKADLENDIESVELPLWKIDATVGNNVIDVKLTGPFYGVRAFGLSLGIRF